MSHPMLSYIEEVDVLEGLDRTVRRHPHPAAKTPPPRPNPSPPSLRRKLTEHYPGPSLDPLSLQ